MKKKLFSILISITMLLAVMSGVGAIAHAQDLDDAVTVKYVDENGVERTASCTIMTSRDNYSFESGGWYAVTSDVTIKNRITNNAYTYNPAHLILADGCTLNTVGI